MTTANSIKTRISLSYSTVELRSRLDPQSKMFQKLVPFFACLALARGGAIGVAHLNTGASIQSRSQDNLGNYHFAYDIVDPLGARNGREERGDGYGNKAGSYALADIDGRVRRVDYVADALGFRATINTNEPGTATSDTAAASYLSPHAAVVAPAGLAVAHAHAAPVLAAPYAHAAPLAHGYAAPLGLAHGYAGYAAPIAHAHLGAPIAHAGLLAPHGLAAPHLAY